MVDNLFRASVVSSADHASQLLASRMNTGADSRDSLLPAIAPYYRDHSVDVCANTPPRPCRNIAQASGKSRPFRVAALSRFIAALSLRLKSSDTSHASRRPLLGDRPQLVKDNGRPVVQVLAGSWVKSARTVTRRFGARV
jgi:hypothetical protein